MGPMSGVGGASSDSEVIADQVGDVALQQVQVRLVVDWVELCGLGRVMWNGT
ncbi:MULTISPECIES: hypothetical protein [Candidatus Ichthyocystis]|uniref:hypothetical protein n=1 Tax=Candidatus Ichthyocystis TaxID=2929841 RepID=UPI0015859F47|nr:MULTISPECIES: hypothetical protein [Ichthyocystis]